MPTVQDPDHDVPATTGAPRQGALALRQAARVAGIAYLFQYVTSVVPEFYLRPALIVAGDAARTASNIAAHAELFRMAIVSDLLAGVGVVILNAALYQLLAPVHRGLARLAAFWRLVEVSVGGALAVIGFIVLSLLSGAEPLRSFEPRELQGLAHVFVDVRESGYMVLLLFFGLGSTTYMYLLVRSRYVPRWLALLGFVGSVLVAPFALTRMLFPAVIAWLFAAVRTLPPAAWVLLALVFLPLLLFELVFGFWLLMKGIRIPAFQDSLGNLKPRPSSNGDCQSWKGDL
jgi:hypothetical protein